MEYIVVSGAALAVSALTLFSGFGLGTLLMPVFALFFPIEVAVASTAVVHLANNIFKLALIGRKADFRVVLSFALPGAILAVVGALLLTYLSNMPPIANYTLGTKTFSLTVVKTVVAMLIAGFALWELLPALEKIRFDRKYLPLGGALSGFFGGLSGHQGALRSAFLAKMGLETEAFIGTSAVCAFVVDASRLLVYGVSFLEKDFATVAGQGGAGLVAVATMAAFLGTSVSTRLVRQVTMKTIRPIVGVMLVALAVALGTGLV